MKSILDACCGGKMFYYDKMTKGSYSKTYETYPPTYVMDDCLK